MEGIRIQSLDWMQEGLSKLPFKLTAAQDTALSEVLNCFAPSVCCIPARCVSS